MFKRMLIANRGEIALRIIRACRELDIESVAVYSTADAESLHVRFADDAVCIGPPPSSESYLNTRAILTAAQITQCDALHPGYGFLAENAAFADMCRDHDLAFVGPRGDVIRRMGDKAEAKRTMREAGVPCIPGSPGLIEGLDEARAFAEEVGYPVILKATAGGGGRGMRVARSADELENAFSTARAEAEAGFGNAGLYLEKFLEHPRHVELQILGDKLGNVIHLMERDCSIQRRHQKLVEECPSPAVGPELREQMGAAAVNAARAVGYDSAGTMEFLLEDGRFYFMEMNTRIQVEHPVTEMVTGVDLIRQMILAAAGLPIEFRQEDIRIVGHAIECRINAEDPAKGFRPHAGLVKALHVPGGIGVRVDSHIYQGYQIPSNYDSLLGKLIVHAPTRTKALDRMKRALGEYIIEGVRTTIPFHLQLMADPAFRSGDFDIKFLESWTYQG
ncbi:MAG: acetyl-CoA carboxylase biotin carboxylase subunit [bacterium]|nr:acetyl-CoA carboxylase biotin carboxylase subunit [bacterium]